jgi:hypothetical protein
LMWSQKPVFILYRDTLNLYTPCAGMPLGTLWHLLVRTLSECGTWVLEAMESVFMSSVAMATNFTPVYFIQITRHYWSLVVIRYTLTAYMCFSILSSLMYVSVFLPSCSLYGGKNRETIKFSVLLSTVDLMLDSKIYWLAIYG